MKGISHITFICKDIEKSSNLFQKIFDAKEVYSSNEQFFSLSKEKFLLIGELWIALMEGSSIQRSYNHIAFHISEEEFAEYQKRIQELNLEILPSRSHADEEGKSIYFYDYDNHLFEFHTGDLATRLKYYKKFNVIK